MGSTGSEVREPGTEPGYHPASSPLRSLGAPGKGPGDCVGLPGIQRRGRGAEGQGVGPAPVGRRAEESGCGCHRVWCPPLRPWGLESFCTKSRLPQTGVSAQSLKIHLLCVAPGTDPVLPRSPWICSCPSSGTLVGFIAMRRDSHRAQGGKGGGVTHPLHTGCVSPCLKGRWQVLGNSSQPGNATWIRPRPRPSPRTPGSVPAPALELWISAHVNQQKH